VGSERLHSIVSSPPNTWAISASDFLRRALDASPADDGTSERVDAELVVTPAGIVSRPPPPPPSAAPPPLPAAVSATMAVDVSTLGAPLSAKELVEASPNHDSVLAGGLGPSRAYEALAARSMRLTPSSKASDRAEHIYEDIDEVKGKVHELALRESSSHSSSSDNQQPAQVTTAVLQLKVDDDLKVRVKARNVQSYPLEEAPSPSLPLTVAELSRERDPDYEEVDFEVAEEKQLLAPPDQAAASRHGSGGTDRSANSLETARNDILDGIRLMDDTIQNLKMKVYEDVRLDVSLPQPQKDLKLESEEVAFDLEDTGDDVLPEDAVSERESPCGELTMDQVFRENFLGIDPKLESGVDDDGGDSPSPLPSPPHSLDDEDQEGNAIQFGISPPEEQHFDDYHWGDVGFDEEEPSLRTRVLKDKLKLVICSTLCR